MTLTINNTYSYQQNTVDSPSISWRIMKRTSIKQTHSPHKMTVPSWQINKLLGHFIWRACKAYGNVPYVVYDLAGVAVSLLLVTVTIQCYSFIIMNVMSARTGKWNVTFDDDSIYDRSSHQQCYTLFPWCGQQSELSKGVCRKGRAGSVLSPTLFTTSLWYEAPFSRCPHTWCSHAQEGARRLCESIALGLHINVYNG